MTNIDYVHPPEHFLGNVPLTPATRVGPFLYVSGTPGFNVAGEIDRVNFSAQMRQVMDNITRILHSVGAGWDRVAKVNVFLTRSQDVQEMNTIYRQYFSTAYYPARTTVIVASLPQPDFLVEIECQAVVA